MCGDAFGVPPPQRLHLSLGSEPEPEPISLEPVDTVSVLTVCADSGYPVGQERWCVRMSQLLLAAGIDTLMSRAGKEGRS